MSDYRSAAYGQTEAIPEREQRLKRFAVAHPRLLVHRDSFVLGEPFIIPACSEYFRMGNGLSLQGYFALKHSESQHLKEGLKIRLERLLFMRKLVVAHCRSMCLCFCYLSFPFLITLTRDLITAIASNLRMAKSKQITKSTDPRQNQTAPSCNCHYQSLICMRFVSNFCSVYRFTEF